MSKSLINVTTEHSYPFEMMMEKGDLLERVELCFVWGKYQLRVLRWHFVRFEPGTVIPFHKHSEFEFHFIPRGKGNVTIFNQHYAFDSGMFYLTGPGVVHEQRVNAKTGVDELCLHIDITLADMPSNDLWEVQESEKCIEILSHFPFHPQPDQFDAMSCFLQAFIAWHEGKIGAYSTLKQALTQILIRSAKTTEVMNVDITYPERDLGFHRMQMALQITVQEVSNRIGISARHLQRLFSKYSHTSFSNYIEDYRLKRICEDILHTTDTIDTIAKRHGFLNSNYLYPVFKKKYQMTPLLFREQGEKTEHF